MQKIYFSLVLLVSLFTLNNRGVAQSVLDPNDPVITYDQSNPPTQPPFGQIGKWVRTVRLGWNTTSYKAYIYKGCAFRLKFPKTYNPDANDGKKYPMLVFFHGLGETGSIYDNEYQLYHGGDDFAAAVDNGSFDGYVLCMQSQGFWGSGQYQYITEIIDYMVANNKLDPFRITDNGLSAGGQGTWEMMFNHPTYIAAGIPMSAVSIGYKDSSNVNELKYTPIWLFQGGLDGSPAPPTAQQVRDGFLNAGADFTYTEYPDLGHGVWDRVWTEPDFYPFLLRGYSSNPWPLFGRTEFCPGDAINVTLGLAPGFDAYEWRKNGVLINGANSNSINVNDTATYDARVKRGNIWSNWSHTPVYIKLKDPTIPPSISVAGLMSDVIPASDGNNFVNLQVPSNYTSYTWKKVGSDSVYGSTNVLKAVQPGNYKVSVTELYGCTSVFSSPFTVINANGVNAPGPASSLTAISLSNTQIELDWAQNPKPLFNETAFEIYRSTKSGNGYTYVGQVPKDTISFVDQNLIPNTKYYYIVRAVNLTAASAISNEASAITQSDKVPPSAPSNLKVASTTNTSAKLIWSTATDNVAIDRYDVYINGVKSYTTADTSILINGLSSGQLYTFYVKAKDVSGNYSTQSNQVNAAAVLQGLQYKYYEGSWSVLPDFNTLTPVKTGTSTNTDISVANREDQFGFVWQGFIRIPVSGTYTFETNSDDGSKLWLGSYDANATPLVNNDGLHAPQFASGTITLQAGVYPISAAFFEQGGGQLMELYWTCSAAFGDNSRHYITDNYFSDSYTAAGTAPSVPLNLAAQVLAYNQIKLSWTDNSNNETGFEIYRSANAAGPFQIVATVNANTTSYSDSLLSASTTYYYQVNAVNQYGSSLSSGLKYSYYEGTWDNLPDFNSLTPIKTGYLNNVSLSPANNSIHYAFKYEGNINIPATGSYTFYTTSDDGSKLYIDGFNAANVVVNNDYLQAPTERSGTINLTKGVHPIYITFFQKEGGAALSAAYQSSAIAKQAIPDDAFVSSFVSATTSALPAAPAKPTNVKAVAQSSSIVKLTWIDNATNETGYKIYRSVNDSLHFKFLASLAINAKTYSDSSLFAHITYYYKVSVIGAGDTYNNAAAVSVKTKDDAPLITNIESSSVRYGVTTVIKISATDVDGDSLSYTIKNKPSWATLTNNGNNTANLTLNPKAANQGNYNTIQIIANDNNGGKDTTAPFTLIVNSNYDPTFDSIPDYTIAENDNVIINLNGHDQNTTDNLTWAVINVPNNYSITTINNTTAKLLLHPNYGAAGTYIVSIKVSDGNGGFAIRTFNLTVNDKDPNKTIYARFKNVDDIGTPWNNITGVITDNLKDANNNATTVGLHLQTSWFATSNAGPNTGNNSGVYPDAVLKDYYYFGIFGGPDSVTVQLTGLDTTLKYNLTFLAASSWTGTTDNGTTTFTSGNQTVSLYVQNNTQNTVSINGLKADASGNIYFKMAKAAGTPVGYINAVVINSILDDGTAPLTPSSLIAQGTGTGVQLSWKDVSYNESNFKIYRSIKQTTGYTLVNTVAANSTAYLDISAKGTTQYFYKILASNNYGNSDYSNIASILTADKVPTLNAISDVVLKNNAQLTVQVVANDDASDHVTLTASQLPSFVTFTDNGNGTGSFLIKPTTGIAGFYEGITVMATDNSDSSNTATFNITVTDNNTTSLYLNFSDGSAANKPWNNLSGWPFAGTVFNNLKDDNNNASPVTVTLVDGFQGVVASGMRPGNDKGIYPDVVMRTGEFEGSTSAKTIKISGLSTNKKYSFIFFNSHEDGLNGTTNFTINGQTVTLNATYNINKTVQINGITPDANGQVVISIAKANGADYAYISSLIIQAYDNSVSLINPTGLIVTDTKRNAVSLSWTDKSFDETGFQIWRSDSSSGSYNLINTVAANTTIYTDQNLVQNKTYYYLVRAINNSNHSDYSNVAVAYTLAYAVYINFTVDSVASSPWNNTLVPPQKGYAWNNFVDESNYQSGISLTELNEFAGLYGDGNVTGNNSGIFPDAVISQSYGLFPGQTAYLKLSGLNLNMNYDLTFFASSRAYGDVNVAYNINGKTVMLDASLNTTGTITVYGILPDANGEINISVAPGTSTSQFGLIGAMIIQAHDKPVLTLPQQPPSFVNAIASSSVQRVQKTVQQITVKAFDNINSYPNPFISNFTVSFKLPKADDVQAEMYNINGQLVYQKRFKNLTAGNNSLNIIPQNNLPSGVYLIKLTSVAAKNSTVLKLIKQ
jgi:predicted esterase